MKKEDRIKNSNEIGQIVNLRQRVYSDYFYIYYRKAPLKTRVAVSVSKKIGHAVERNYAKRVVRELLRHRIESYPAFDLVIVVKPELLKSDYSALESAMDMCLNLILKKNDIKKEQ